MQIGNTGTLFLVAAGIMAQCIEDSAMFLGFSFVSEKKNGPMSVQLAELKPYKIVS